MAPDVRGLRLSLRSPRRWFQSLSLWVILYFNWLGVVFFGSLRMRLPVESLVVLFAAADSKTWGDACGRDAPGCGW